MITDSAPALNERLRRRYADVVDLPLLLRLAAQRELSGLFVPAVGDAYLRSRVRTMIVGRETAGWGNLRTDLAVAERAASIDTYLAHQMDYHQRKIGQIRATSKFFQFYREASRKVAGPQDRSAGNVPIWPICSVSTRTGPGRTARTTPLPRRSCNCPARCCGCSWKYSGRNGSCSQPAAAAIAI
jgi:hypothetical protein